VLAITSTMTDAGAVDVLLLAAGGLAVALVMYRFSRR
jgi:hypothetical protein